jgi:hypothetical protein
VVGALAVEARGLVAQVEATGRAQTFMGRLGAAMTTKIQPRTNTDFHGLGTPQESILLVGQMAGMSLRIDVVELEKFLADPPKDFRYAAHCRAAIGFRNALYPRVIRVNPCPSVAKNSSEAAR